MKKLCVISFLFIYMSANTTFGEVLKFPVLIHHYLQHAREDKDNSIFDFLAKHYNGSMNHKHNANNHDHEKLPFKTADHHFAQIVSVAPTPLFFSVTIPASTDLKISVHKQQNYSNAYLSCIWQPPKNS